MRAWLRKLVRMSCESADEAVPRHSLLLFAFLFVSIHQGLAVEPAEQLKDPALKPAPGRSVRACAALFAKTKR